MKNYPANSTAYYTDANKRLNRVMRRTHAADVIQYAGVYSCRKIAGSSTWSDHAYGAASDLFTSERERVARAVVRQATKRTLANFGRKLHVRYAIYDDQVWTPDSGWHKYYGTFHGTHVHVSVGRAPVGKPECA